MKNLSILFLWLISICSLGQTTDALQTTATNNTIRNITAPGGITKGNVADRFQDLINSKVSRGETITASGTDTYTATGNSTLVYTQNFLVVVKFTNANTGASTLNINGLGAKSIKKNVSDATTSGDITAGQIFLLVYDGTNFQLIGGGGGTPFEDLTGAVTSIGSATSLGTFSSANFSGAVTDEIGTGNVVLSNVGTNSQSDSYTLATTDKGVVVEMTKASASNLTFAPNSTLNWDDGAVVYVKRTGTSSTPLVTFVAGSGVTLVTTNGTLTDAGQYVAMTCIMHPVNTWTIQNGLVSTGVPTSRTIAGLDLTTNRTASEVSVAIGSILQGQVTGSTINRYHGSSLVVLSGSLTTGTLTSGQLRASPLIVAKNVTVDRIQAEVTTLGASAKLHLCIYADNGSGYPGALMSGGDSGELDAGSTGVKNATISCALTPGLYWLAALGGTATATYRVSSVTAIGWPDITGHDPAEAGTVREPFWSVTQSYGSCPSTFTGGGSVNTTSAQIPLIYVRY